PKGVAKEESLKSYLLGEKDGVPKTPEWAEKICRVPVAKIREIARAYATAKPAALIQGWGAQRQAYGEQFMRGGAQLACLTGNVGK
ncbi:molybdopterin-dependent oxidoreductase, partial [Alkalihalophilus pseudofirmus]|nr:molybdopterin-dependent oxidoreductase [Alkalihalophilus pseudofirmus]